MRPAEGTFPDYYAQYIALAPQADILSALMKTGNFVEKTIHAIDPAQFEHRYAPGKWSVRQVLTHIIDTERIMVYRALRFARGDAQKMPSFEENAYAAAMQDGDANPELLLEEFSSVRIASITFFKNISEATLLRTGDTIAGKASVVALGFMLCGHGVHHCNVVKERYLQA
jgi:hypothetical protein